MGPRLKSARITTEPRGMSSLPRSVTTLLVLLASACADDAPAADAAPVYALAAAAGGAAPAPAATIEVAKQEPSTPVPAVAPAVVVPAAVPAAIDAPAASVAPPAPPAWACRIHTGPLAGQSLTCATVNINSVIAYTSAGVGTACNPNDTYGWVSAVAPADAADCAGTCTVVPYDAMGERPAAERSYGACVHSKPPA